MGLSAHLAKEAYRATLGGMGRYARILGLMVMATSLAACVSEMVCDPHDPSRCAMTGGPGEAAATAAIAAGAWAVVGCTVNGCHPPYACNYETKQCELQPCGEGIGSCPPGYRCHEVKHVCW